MTSLKIQHLRLCPYTLRTEHIRELFIKFKAAGFNAVMIEYENVFPYTDFPELKSESTYTPEEISAIDSYAEESGIELIPKGLSFSHIDYLLKVEKYKHLADGNGSLNLLARESFEIICRSTENLLQFHPSSKIIHLGGDEMFNLGRAPETSDFVTRHGISRLYVQFVNKLTERLKAEGLRIAIWSDMIIRYPEAIDEMDKDTIIFYWNYWSGAERVPFISIGGGMTDTFMLDRSKMSGDLEKMFRVSMVKEKNELPIGHVELFKYYWDMDDNWKSCRGFPYFSWFRDKGFDVVASMLSYPEKGSFLANMGEKNSHIKTFMKETSANSGMGFMTCCWQACWPLIESIWPSLLFAQKAHDNPLTDDDDIYKCIAEEMGDLWTQDILKKYYNLSCHFEFADILDSFWRTTPVKERIRWLTKAGWIEDDMARVKNVLKNADEILNGKFSFFAGSCYEKFLVEDIEWRAECQMACYQSNSADAAALIAKGGRLQERALFFIETWYRPHVSKLYIADRYLPWFDALRETAERV